MNYGSNRRELGYWVEKESRLEAAHLLDLLNTVQYDQLKKVTPFLTIGMREWFWNVMRKERLKYLAVGGFPGAERMRIVVAPEGETLSEDDGEIDLLFVAPVDPEAKLEHRQILGSLIGMGIKRGVIGDILPGRGGMYVATAQEITPYLIREWNQAGRAKIRVTRVEGEVDLVLQTGEERRITVQSSRLDAILAQGFGVSRSKAQEWILHGNVRKNDRVILKAETEVHPGDLISCRGKGRIRMVESSLTRKGRIAWMIRVFRSQRH